MPLAEYAKSLIGRLVTISNTDKIFFVLGIDPNVASHTPVTTYWRKRFVFASSGYWRFTILKRGQGGLY